MRPDLTLTYGLRWQYHSVPFEANGYESVPTTNIDQVFNARVAAAAAGMSGNDAAPLVSYNLGGAANNAPGYYKPDYHDFGPRLGIAYSPSFSDGLLGAIFGNRKTTVRAGGGIYYDRVLSTLSFELDEQTFLFDSNPHIVLRRSRRGQRSDDEPAVEPAVHGDRGDSAGADSARGHAATGHAQRGCLGQSDRSCGAWRFSQLSAIRQELQDTVFRYLFVGNPAGTEGQRRRGGQLFRQIGPEIDCRWRCGTDVEFQGPRIRASS